MRLLLAALLLAPLSLAAQPHLTRVTDAVGPRFPSFVQDGRPVLFVPFDGQAAFTGTDATGDVAVWVTDGTEAGTETLTPPEAGGPAFPSAPLAAFEGEVYVAGLDGDNRQRLWRVGADGVPQQVSTAEYVPGTFAAQDEVFYFTGCTDAEGCEPYASNGQATSLLQDIRPGAGSSDPRGYTHWGGFTYFVADDGQTGREVWRTMGTQASTDFFLDVFNGVQGSQVGGFLPGSSLLFVAEGREAGQSAVTGIYATDGTPGEVSLRTEAGLATYFLGTAGTDTPIVAYRETSTGQEPHALDGDDLVLLADIFDGTNGSLSGSRPLRASFGDHLAFTALARVGFTQLDQLWLTDGASARRVAIPDEPTYAHYSKPVTLAGDLYFAVVPRETISSDPATEVWRLASPDASPEFVGALPQGADLVGWNAFGDGLLVSVANGSLEANELWGIGFGTSTAGEGAPEAGALAVRVAPNPVRGTTTISFTLDEASTATLTAHDALGREVAVLSDGLRQSGEHVVRWDASAFPAGVYLVRLATPTAEVTQTVSVVR